jgi:hypothetical protein
MPRHDPVQSVTGRQFCAKSGHSATARQKGHIELWWNFVCGINLGRSRWWAQKDRTLDSLIKIAFFGTLSISRASNRLDFF